MNARIALTITALFVNAAIFAQTPKKILIGKSGCSISGFCTMKFDASKSPDSSMVYAGECPVSGTNYGAICVQLLHPPSDLSIAEQILSDYLDYLKSSFNITSATGYEKGKLLNNNDLVKGISDNWTDKEKNSWKVQAWTDGKYIVVLYGYSNKEMSESKLSAYFSSLQFPK